MQILIADDHSILRKTIRMMLLESYPNALIDEVPDALGLLNKASEKKWDIIISDISMPPGLTGLDVLPEIKQLNPETPVIILSMHSKEAYADKAIHLGASFYLNKSQVSFERVKMVDKAVSIYKTPKNKEIKTGMLMAFS